MKFFQCLTSLVLKPVLTAILKLFLTILVFSKQTEASKEIPAERASRTSFGKNLFKSLPNYFYP
jgi:hypothetical protein